MVVHKSAAPQQAADVRRLLLVRVYPYLDTSQHLLKKEPPPRGSTLASAKTPDSGLNCFKFLIGVELPILVSNIVCRMVKLTVIVYPCLRIRQLVIILLLDFSKPFD